MNEPKQNRLLNNIVSPYGLAMISYAFFLFSCLIPPSLYTHYMKEPDLMFLDPATILFYTLCVASFVTGAWLVGWLFSSSFSLGEIHTIISPTLFLLLPLWMGIVISVVVDLYLIARFPNILLALMMQQGGDIKDTLSFSSDVNGHIFLVPFVLAGLTWWAFWRYPDFGIQGWRRLLVLSSLLVAMLVLIVSAALTLNRVILILPMIGLAILHIMRKVVRKQMNSKFVFRSSLMFTSLIFLMFFGFSFLRGTDSWDGQVNSFLGYTLASYNRLAAIVNGYLRYPLGGHGMYLSSVISQTRILPFRGIFNPPDYLEVWGAEFGAVSNSGLDGRLIWSGAFGYVFSDLGWFSLPFLLGYGILYGIIWNRLKRGRVFGVVLYPFFGFCVLFWVGSNYLLDVPMEVFLIVASLLAGYEFALLRRT
jgi:hypothetical protein